MSIVPFDRRIEQARTEEEARGRRAGPTRDPSPARECGSVPCPLYHPGHLIHPSHANQLRLTPWGWRDGTVREIHPDNVAVIDYVDGGTAEIWQHHDLSIVAPPGTPVRLHERFYALEAGRAVLNVLLLSGVGPVLEPAEPRWWAGEGSVIVVDLRTGQGFSPPA